MSVTYVGSGYAEHLTDADLELLSAVSGTGSGVAGLRREPGTIPKLLDHPRVFEALYGRPGTASGLPEAVSPFLAFAVAVHRAAAELPSMSYVPERSGLRQRVPVFDAPQLSAFLDSRSRQLFLAELLASFTRVASGRYRVRTAHGWRSRRFSELDPVRLAGLLEAVPEAERPGVYRRLGDVALFLAGVFPDYAIGHAFGPIDTARLLRGAQVVTGEEKERLVTAPTIELLEHLGARWYRRACDLAPMRSARLEVVAEVAERFQSARRVLNHLADRYLFPVGNPWFTPPGPR
jgi:hypothetical protein